MCGLLPSGKRLQFPIEHGPVEIVDLPITNGGSVCLVFVNVYQAGYHEISKIPTYQDCCQSYTRYFSAVIVTCCYISVIYNHLPYQKSPVVIYQLPELYQVPGLYPNICGFLAKSSPKESPQLPGFTISTQKHTPRPWGQCHQCQRAPGIFVFGAEKLEGFLFFFPTGT